MEITSLTISQDRKTLNLAINDSTSISALRLWTTNTYKDFSKVIDLTSFLTGGATEMLSFTPSDLGILYFDGVYFVEAEDPSGTSLALVLDSTRYKECILNQLLEMGVCDECLKTSSLSLINSQTMLNGLTTAVELGFIDEIVTITIALDKYCSSSCKTCGDYNNLVSEAYYTL